MKRFFIISVWGICYLLVTNVVAQRYVYQYVIAHIKQNPEAVKNYLWKSCECKKPNAEAAYILGDLYLNGDYVGKNHILARYFIRKSASMQYLPAIKSLADGYYSGDIEEKDIQKAFSIYEYGAKKGNGACQFNAGVMLLNGLQTKNRRAELKESVFWLKKSRDNKENFGITNEFIESYIEKAIIMLGRL